MIKTIVNAGETFQCGVALPSDEPPGLYFYHPHVHGLSEHAVQGGATGAILVEGLQHLQPAVQGLPQRLLMIRDQPVPGSPAAGGNIPDWDVSVNYVPITSPTRPTGTDWVPAILPMVSGVPELWSICNSASDTVLDLQYRFDGVAQPMYVVSIDGVPVNSQDGAQASNPSPIPVTHFVLPTASRVEVIVSAPPPSVILAQLITLAIDTGPDGDNDPQRPLMSIRRVSTLALSATPSSTIAPFTGGGRRFAGLAAAPIATHRTVFFDEINATSTFFMAVEGQPEHVFDPNNPPDVIVTQGTTDTAHGSAFS